MFHAAFNAYCPIRDESDEEFQVRLDDEAIERMLRALDQGRSNIRVSVQSAAADVDAGVTLDWDVDCAGFMVRVAGRSAGFIPFDELHGALGKHLGEDETPVHVCLRGDVDIWRRGVFSASKGQVLVYTATQGLGFLGMEGYRVCGGGRSECFTLNGGDPSRSLLHVPAREMTGIARARGAAPVVDHRAVLSGLVPQLEPFA